MLIPLLFLAGAAYAPETVKVIDADTLRIDGVNSRIENLDAPETGWRAECDAERMLAVQANKLAEKLVAENEILLTDTGKLGGYKRPLIRVSVNGRDWAEIMIEANLAVKWAGKTHDWCGGADS